MEKLNILFLIFCLAIGVSGCADSNLSSEKHFGKNDEENSELKGKAELLKEQTLSYLEKYDDTFAVENLTLKGIIQPFHTIVVHSSKYDENFQVYIYEEGKEFTFEDDYFQLDMSNEASEYVYSLIQSKLPNASVKVAFLDQSIDYKGEIKTFQDYLNSGWVGINSYIFLENIDYERNNGLFKEVVLELNNHDVLGAVKFVSTSTDISEMVPTNTLQSLLKLEAIVASQTFMIDSSENLATTPVKEYSYE
ncbi:hypothetical protein H9636_09470 [Ureibacillus sp. Re31]|uniref:Lipoprotein n=1 Tax=Ureibacillus galli TaxID=2762222 RepID=A0ABR8XCE7_9BACL|nr:hypothetical protein [Ureibacillus galli]MBD8026888.1 hypothetical protein [Ureibacillus galli]